jgi:hypothetical protein
MFGQEEVVSSLNILKPTGYVIQQQVYIKEFFILPHYIYGFCVYLRTNSDVLSVFITDMISVYSAVRTGPLNKAVCASSLKG